MKQTTVQNTPATQIVWEGGSRQLFKIYEVAEILGVHPSTIRRLVARDELQANLKLRHLLITRASIQRFINAGEDL
jgi:excisionase family DNA binding protein